MMISSKQWMPMPMPIRTLESFSLPQIVSLHILTLHLMEWNALSVSNVLLKCWKAVTMYMTPIYHWVRDPLLLSLKGMIFFSSMLLMQNLEGGLQLSQIHANRLYRICHYLARYLRTSTEWFAWVSSCGQEMVEDIESMQNINVFLEKTWQH